MLVAKAPGGDGLLRTAPAQSFAPSSATARPRASQEIAEPAEQTVADVHRRSEGSDESVYGVRGMGGIVRDWCHGIFGAYPNDATDPTGPSSGHDRVWRGGSWRGIARFARCAHRIGSVPSHRVARS